MTDSTIYNSAAEEVQEIFADYMNGAVACLALAISDTPLPKSAHDALTKSFAAFGYSDADVTFATLHPCATQSTSDTVAAFGHAAEPAKEDNCSSAPVLDASALFLLVEGLDPLCVVICDAAAAACMEAAYRIKCSHDSALRVLGRPCVVFNDFAHMVKSTDEKQRAWALLKTLPRIKN